MGDSVPFAELVDVNPPRRLKRGGRYPYVEMAAVPEGGGRPTYHQEREFDNSGSRFAVGDTLFARITPCTENGKLAYVDALPNGDVGFGSTEFIVLSARPGRADPRFVYQVAASSRVRRHAVSRMLGTSGRQRVPTWFFTDELTVPDFALPEQRRIAAVLDAVDETIEQTEAVIAATKEARKAVLNDLLTRGVPGRHTEWKHVPGLGTIPACWDVLRLQDVADTARPGALQSGPFGSSLLHSEFGNEGKLVIGIDNVLRGSFSLGRQNRISTAKFKELQRYQVRPRDVLITVMASLGRVCVVPDDIEEGIVTKHVYRISADQSRVNPWFLMWTLLASPGVLTQLYGSAQGQTRLGLNGEILKAVQLPIPRLPEQGAVAATLDALSCRIAVEETQLAHLNETKAALSEALLSGRVRVKPRAEVL